MNKLESLWQFPTVIYGCTICGSYFLCRKDNDPSYCPACGENGLLLFGGDEEITIYEKEPELVIPFTFGKKVVGERLKEWAQRHGGEYGDLKVVNLLERLRPVYLTRWLVDTEVQSYWAAEVGERYETAVYQERFESGRWFTEESTEYRYHWIPHLGRVRKVYHNLEVGAYEGGHWLLDQLGEFDMKKGVAYTADYLDENGFVFLPTRDPVDSWVELEPIIQKEMEADCQEALGGRPLQDFRWSPQKREKEWSKGLLPVYTSYYFDGKGKRRMVYLNGESGLCIGDYIPDLGRLHLTLIRKIAKGLIFSAAGLLLLITAIFHSRGSELLDEGSACIVDGFKEYEYLMKAYKDGE